MARTKRFKPTPNHVLKAKVKELQDAFNTAQKNMLASQECLVNIEDEEYAEFLPKAQFKKSIQELYKNAAWTKFVVTSLTEDTAKKKLFSLALPLVKENIVQVIPTSHASVSPSTPPEIGNIEEYVDQAIQNRVSCTTLNVVTFKQFIRERSHDEHAFIHILPPS